MRIRYLADLHLEFRPASALQSCGEDVVVLAGDIDLGIDGILWARETFQNVPVLYLLGNHEFYGHHFDNLITEARAACANSNVQLLENDAVVIGGVRFLGCTLWTDFELLGRDGRGQALEEASLCMNDFRLIARGPLGMRRSVLPIETAERHLMSRRWLEREIAISKEPVVVVTHHAPCTGTSHPQHAGDPLSPAFASDLTALLQPPVKAWIFGHTHYSVDFERQGVRILSNQRGYPQERLTDFSWNRCIDLAADGQITGGLRQPLISPASGELR